MLKINSSKLQKGFTLIELLVVIGILAVLLAITLIAINPARQFAQANNTQRASDVNAILNAVHQYLVDSKGVLPAGLVSGDVDKPISSAVGGTGEAFCSALVTLYIAALPVDPQSGTPFTTCLVAGGGYATGYTISVSAADNRLTVKATTIELGTQISVTR